MQQMMRRLAKPDAAKHVVDLLVGLNPVE